LRRTRLSGPKRNVWQTRRRARRRERDLKRRAEEDLELQARMAREIAHLFPGCPPDRAQAFARHAATRGSGRVGRSAAGRGLEADAIELALAAAVRHEDTCYDRLLMSGLEQGQARAEVRGEVASVGRLAAARTGSGSTAIYGQSRASASATRSGATEPLPERVRGTVVTGGGEQRRRRGPQGPELQQVQREATITLPCPNCDGDGDEGRAARTVRRSTLRAARADLVALRAISAF
jgi:hypothetical protein